MINLETAKNNMSKEDYERFKDLYDRSLTVPHLSRVWFALREEMFEDFILKYNLDDGNPYDLGNESDINFLGKVTILLIEDKEVINNDFKLSLIKKSDNELVIPTFPIKYHKETEVESLKGLAKEHLGIEVISYELLNIDKGYSEDHMNHVPLNYIYIIKKFKRLEEKENVVLLSFKDAYREYVQISRKLFHNDRIDKSKLKFNLSDKDMDIFKRIFYIYYNYPNSSDNISYIPLSNESDINNHNQNILSLDLLKNKYEFIERRLLKFEYIALWNNNYAVRLKEFNREFIEKINIPNVSFSFEKEKFKIEKSMDNLIITLAKEYIYNSIDIMVVDKDLFDRLIEIELELYNEFVLHNIS